MALPRHLGPVSASATRGGRSRVHFDQDGSVWTSEGDVSQFLSPPQMHDVTLLLLKFKRKGRTLLTPHLRLSITFPSLIHQRDKRSSLDMSPITSSITSPFLDLECFTFSCFFSKNPIFRYPVLSSCDSCSLILPPH